MATTSCYGPRRPGARAPGQGPPGSRALAARHVRRGAHGCRGRCALQRWLPTPTSRAHQPAKRLPATTVGHTGGHRTAHPQAPPGHLLPGPYPIVWADALVVKVREAGRTANVHVLVGTGVTAQGAPQRSSASELPPARMRPARSLSGARWWHGGSRAWCSSSPMRTRASSRRSQRHLPGATWQRCRTHDLAGSARQGGHVASSPRVATLVRTIVDAPDAHEVDAQLHRVIEALVGKLPEAADHLEQAREDLLALAALPLASSGARS